MAEKPIGSIEKNFGGLEDPRIERKKLHKLLDIIVIAICGVICGADNWVDIEMFGIKKEVWLRQFLELPNGIPSHDTFGRVFGLLNAEQFQGCFFEWVKAVNEVTSGQVIALDGKQLRGSMDNYLGKGAIYMVNAWANTNQVVLGQRKVDDKSNEITAIPELLAMLEISGCIITIDAMGCQTEIAHQIVARQGDYVLAVKENQAHLHEDIAYLFELYLKEENPLAFVDGYQKTVDKNHGRIEIRPCWTLSADRYQQSVRRLAEWEQVRSLVMIVSERRIGQKVTTQARYFISSLKPDATKLLGAVRSHWGVENSLHWVLDVVFDEDHSRIRKDNAPQNIAVIRQMALNLLKNEKTAKGGIQAKRLQAAWDENYLLKVLTV
jgi:predicted transposase YbfD/YdcC